MGGKDKKKQQVRKGATFHAVHMTDIPDGKRRTKQKKSKTVHVVNVVEPTREKKKVQLSAVVLALVVRLLMVVHNLLTAWRVVMMYEDRMWWILTAGNLLIILEGLVIIKMRGGVEYSWWCPCFAAYLLSTLPGIWLIQLNQNTFQKVETIQNVTLENVSDVITDIAAALSVNNNGTISMAALMANISKLNVVPADTITFTDITSGSVTLTTAYPSIVNNVTAPFVNVTSSVLNVTQPSINSATNLANVTEKMVTSLTNLTTLSNVNETVTPQISNFTTSIANVSSDITTLLPSLTTLMTDNGDNITTPLANVTGKPTFLTIMRMLDNDVWIIIIQEGLVYVLILGRWMLPQREFSRDYLADLLLEFLGIASDIMELLAVFDDDVVRADKELTYIILGVWSASFIQFIPIVTTKRRFRRVDYAKRKQPYCRCCGEKCVEVAATGMSIMLQDGPFLGLRLYIMIYKKLITYSLVFFVLKNIVTLLLLFYRLFVLCCSMPCCYDRKNRVQGVELVDYSQPISQAELRALTE